MPHKRLQPFNEYKESILISIHAQLNCQKEYNKASLYFLGRMIRSYYEYTDNGINTWTKREDIHFIKRYHKVSKRAAALIEQECTYKDLHYEHMIPTSVLRQELIRLDNKDDIEAIRVILESSEVMILSKEEATTLDGSVNRVYTLDGIQTNGRGMKMRGSMEERLSSIEAEVAHEYENNTI